MLPITCITGRINCNARASDARCRIEHHRIDHQRLIAVILADVEAHFVAAVHDVTTRDLAPIAFHGLVGDRLALPNFPAVHGQHQVAVRFDPSLIRAFEGEPDVTRARPGMDDEIVFELSLVAVEDQINSRINRRVSHPCIVGDIGSPLRRIIANQVVALARLFFDAFNPRRRICAENFHADPGGLLAVSHSQLGFIRFQQQAVVRAAR